MTIPIPERANSGISLAAMTEAPNSLSTAPVLTPGTSPVRTPPTDISPSVSCASGSPGRVRVTHHFRDDSTSECSVHHAEVGALDATPRRRRVSVAWESPPNRVLVAAPPHNKQARAALSKLARYLMDVHKVDVLVESKMKDIAPEGAQVVLTRDGAVVDDVHLVVCLGGDGLILHVVSTLFPRAMPPLMPFNMGSLGFLTPFEFSDHQRHMAEILNGRSTNVTMRMRLKCEVVRKPVKRDGSRSPCFHNFSNEQNMLLEEEIADAIAPNAEYHVLNELVIDRGPAPYLSNLEVFCDDCPVTRVQADGLIVATPTGSTAYNLSAGGSMVHPGVPGILFTPICPHSLSFRPVLFPDYVTLQIKVPDDSRASAWVSFDGRHRMELMKGDRVIVSVSPWFVPTFSKLDASNDWFRSISSCLRWNERLVQGSKDDPETSAE